MMLMPVLIAQALSSCSLIDEPKYDDDSNVKASLAFIVSGSSASYTRMSDVVVQDQNVERESRFRGMNLMTLIPFSKQDIIEVDDRPLRLFGEANSTSFPKSSGDYGAFFLYQGYTMMRGTASFLAYGKAPVPLNGSKAVYGSLLENIPATQLPAEISFSPEAIASEEDASKTAYMIAGYLNNIANAQTTDGNTTIKWANTTNSQLRAFYLNFTGQENAENQLLAGSSANVMAHVNALYENVSGLSGTPFEGNTVESRLKADILNRIKTTSTSSGLTLSFDNNKLTSLGVDFPSSIGLPDGAAALLWVTNQFVPQTRTTTTANMNTVTRYCYPAGLYYFANSRIYTSNKENIETYYRTQPVEAVDNVLDWTDVLAQYENTSGVVSGNTTSVAIHDPLHYAVARLKMTMRAETASLVDARGKTITLPTSTTMGFPLTGVIVSSQRPVGFDFKPLSSDEESHAFDSFVYDSQMKIGDAYRCLSTTEQAIPSTLVLQNYDGEEVTIILEFLNDIEDFHSKTGIIYKDTKFYLIGKIKPEENADLEDYEKRVFTRDYVTEVNMKVVETQSLKNAYNVLPDILGGRLEVSVELTPKWYFATPTNVVLGD